MTNQNDYFKTICGVSMAFGTTQDLKTLLDLVVESAVDTMGAKAACLWLIGENENRAVPEAQKGLSEQYYERIFRTTGVEEVLQEGKYLYARDATSDPRLEAHGAKKKEGIASMLIVPVAVRDQNIGFLSLYMAEEREFTEDEINFLMALGEQGGMAIEQARLLQKIRNNTKLFYDLAAGINSSLDVKTIFQTLTTDIAKGFGVKAASVLIVNKEKKTLELMASYGLSDKYLDRGPLFMGESMADTLKGESVLIKDAAKDKRIQHRKEKEEEGIVTLLSIPLQTGDDVIGALRLYDGVPRDFTEDDILMLNALALQGGVAIQNAAMVLQLKEDMKDLKDDIWSHRSWF